MIRNADRIGKKIEELKLPNICVKNDTWLVSYGGTTRELAEALGIRDGVLAHLMRASA